jgi:Fe-S-cluster-containing hydrogenase component 2
VKVCDKFEAITLGTNLAHIDPDKCKMCRKCEEACPRGAIKAFNFPPREPKAEAAPVVSPASPKVEETVAKTSASPIVEKKVETPKDNETAV